MLSKTLQRKNIPFPAAVLMINSILTREVACATCQWIPVVVAVGGVRVVSMMKFLTYKISSLNVQFESSLVSEITNFTCLKKLFWFVNQLLPVLSYGFESNIAIPTNRKEMI